MTGALQFLTGGRRGSFLLAAWAAALILLLQTVAALGNSPHRYSIRLWQIDEGLPNNSVYAVTQTKDGYLWIGTHEGLARFDGVRFVVVDEAVAPELRNGWITALCAASDGSLWAACDGSGVFRLSHGTVVHYTEAEGLPSNKTTCLLETPDGTIWIGTEDGLAHFKNGQFRVYTEKNGLADNSVRDLCLDTNGVLRIATRRGLSGLDKEGRIGTVNFGLGTPMNALKAVCQDHHGNIWVTGNEGVTCVMPDTRVSYTTREGLPDRVATDVVEDRRGLIWVGTYAGLVCIENGKIAAKPLNEHGFGDLVYTIFEDREENLWVGARDGLYRVTPARFTVYTARDGLSSDNVMAVCEDHSGAIWMATWGGGITILRDGKFSYLNTKNGLTHDSVLSLDESHDGSMWVGMDFDGGIDRINHQGKNVFTRPAGFAPAAVRVIHEDAKGTIFVGTSHGLNVIRKGRVNTFTTSRGLAGNTVLAIHETADHAIWIGTDNGLSRWSGGKFTNFTTKQGLSDNTINCIYEDTNHTLWIGTHHGLNRCKEGKFSTYTTTQGLFSDEIYEVVEDDAGSFWMSCRTGLFRVSRQDLEDVAEGRLKAVTSSIYGKSEGLASIQCNGISKPAGWKSRDGRLWFPTIRGVVAVERQAKNTQPPFVVIEEVVADRNTVATSMGEPISSKVALASDHRPLRIRPGHGDLEIQYTALGLRSPEKNRFAYMLQGVDPAWVDAGFRRAAYYNNLAPGHYRFRVKASNNDGVWNETGAAMDIVLLPHFWQTWWFKASIPA
ncbi:MAG TPA: two-component regulator propeller domain-containing protein, partial [Verrucomicrobiae bacterium]|nr:two-component regulator propeller domain-containing protein [Verrucomicrobiae bacterium]